MSSLYPVKRRAPEHYTTEFDILKASHKFLRSGDDETAKTWDAQLAKKYEDSLFKEFAVCDLKHYKSGNIALRWRTEEEVLSGAGEESCGNTRCPYHDLPSPSESGPSRSQDTRYKPLKPRKLTTMELPFSYIEKGETEVRQALVKVVLCERCVKKLMWKRESDKKQRSGTAEQTSLERSAKELEVPEETDPRYKEKLQHHSRSKGRSDARSRSRSPRRRHEP